MAATAAARGARIALAAHRALAALSRAVSSSGAGTSGTEAVLQERLRQQQAVGGGGRAGPEGSVLAAEPPGLTVILTQGLEGTPGRPNPGNEEEEQRRKQRLAAVRRLALRLAGLLGAGTGITIIYIFGKDPRGAAVRSPPPTQPQTPPHVLPSPPGSNAVDEHGAKVSCVSPRR